MIKTWNIWDRGCALAIALVDALIVRRQIKKESFAGVCMRLSSIDQPLSSACDPRLINELCLANARVARLLPGSTCLIRSLALQRRLKVHAIASQLCIGADLGKGRFGAHAWIEVNGVPVNGSTVVGQGFRFRFVPQAALQSVEMHADRPTL